MSEPRNPLSECDTLRALIPAYSIGATDPEETALVERLLPRCPEVAAELEAYMALSEAMLYTAPAAQPPVYLHDRLMAAVAEPPKRTAPRPASKPTAPTTPRPVLKTAPSAVPARPRVIRFNRITAGLAAVAAAFLIVSNVYWVNRVNMLNRQQQDAIHLLADQQDALAALGTGRAQRVELVSTSSTQNGTLATVLWSPQSETALLYTDTLPSLSPDKAYQLWLIQGSQPVSAGVFQVDAQGVGTLIFHTNEPMSDFSAVAISTEPASGSPQPTSDPIALAQI